MGYWLDERTGDEYTFDPPIPEVEVTDNPIVAQLLDHNGEPLRTWRERPAIGFR